MWAIALAFISLIASFGTPKVHPDVLGYGRLRFINVTIPQACTAAGHFTLYVELDEDSRRFEAWLFPVPIKNWEFVPYNSSSIVSVPSLDLSQSSKAELKLSQIKYVGKIFENKDIVAPMEFFTPNKTDFVPTNSSHFNLKLSCPDFKEVIFDQTVGTQFLAPKVKITNAASSHAPSIVSAVVLAFMVFKFLY